MGDLKERLTFIIVCFGLSLSQLLGQTSPSPDKDKIDEPTVLLSKMLVHSSIDRTMKHRLRKTFANFLTYYNSVRHFGENRDEKNYQTIDSLTIHDLDRFRCMTIEIWNVVIAKQQKTYQNDPREVRDISDVIRFEELPQQPCGSDFG